MNVVTEESSRFHPEHVFMQFFVEFAGENPDTEGFGDQSFDRLVLVKKQLAYYVKKQKEQWCKGEDHLGEFWEKRPKGSKDKGSRGSSPKGVHLSLRSPMADGDASGDDGIDTSKPHGWKTGDGVEPETADSSKRIADAAEAIEKMGPVGAPTKAIHTRENPIKTLQQGRSPLDRFVRTYMPVAGMRSAFNRSENGTCW